MTHGHWTNTIVTSTDDSVSNEYRKSNDQFGNNSFHLTNEKRMMKQIRII